MTAVMLMATIGTHDTYLHSWGAIFIQDVVMPFRNKPFTPEQHLRALRLSILGVCIFIFFFSLIFQQSEYIFLFFAITGAIFTGGSGAVIIGGSTGNAEPRPPPGAPSSPDPSSPSAASSSSRSTPSSSSTASSSGAWPCSPRRSSISRCPCSEGSARSIWTRCCTGASMPSRKRPISSRRSRSKDSGCSAWAKSSPGETRSSISARTPGRSPGRWCS